jgi:protocatechuate 3,4-dioxygenase beta subunit
VDTSDRPITGGLIEVWHTDPAGNYDLDGFRYRAGMQTSRQGAYSFETYMPGNYGGRPRHIHYKITAGGYESLVTQLYFENDPFFEGRLEKTLRKDPLVRYRELIRPVVPFRDGRAVTVNFKICLSAGPGKSAKILLEQ